jgi:FkbM family methyltransferase
MTAPLRTTVGLARSLLMYRARPWRHAALTRFYRAIVGRGDLAFDIGAHVGNRTLALRAAGARVVALEPQAAFHAFLSRTLPDDVTLLKLAAGPEPGRAALAVSSLHPTVSSIAPDFPDAVGGALGFTHVAWDGRQSVEVTSLDALIGAHGRPRFIKIDVEGFEAEVLAGLNQPVPWIAFEYLPATLDKAEACLARIESLGRYRFNLVEGEAHGFAEPKWRDAQGTAAALARQAGSGRSGDVYALLEDA